MSSASASGTFFLSHSAFSTTISASKPRKACVKPMEDRKDFIMASQSLWYSGGGDGDGDGVGVFSFRCWGALTAWGDG